MSNLVLTESSLFATRYRVIRCIAMGGMGAVYEVVHLETERRRALKVMLPNIVGSQELRDRFRQEARVAAHIDSDYIVDVFDAGVEGVSGTPFLVMELLRGEELGQRLKRLGRLAPHDVLLYLGQAARALDKTHRASIVHRDLKPENLFLTEREDGTPHIKILDFGIAKFIVDGATGANATRCIGTPLYMAPEQFGAGGTVGPASDIFALGMVAFSALVGVPYWQEDAHKYNNVFAFAGHVRHGPEERATVRASRLGVELPEAFDAWFEKVTALDPKRRYATAGEAIAALSIALGTAKRRDDDATAVMSSGEHRHSKTEPMISHPKLSTSPLETQRVGGRISPVPSNLSDTHPSATLPLVSAGMVHADTLVMRPPRAALSSPRGPIESSSVECSRTLQPELIPRHDVLLRERRRAKMAMGFAAIALLVGAAGIGFAVSGPRSASASVEAPKPSIDELPRAAPKSVQEVAPMVPTIPTAALTQSMLHSAPASPTIAKVSSTKSNVPVKYPVKTTTISSPPKQAPTSGLGRR